MNPLNIIKGIEAALPLIEQGVDTALALYNLFKSKTSAVPGHASLATLSLTQVRDGLFLFQAKNNLARKMAETGKISEGDAHALIEKDLAALPKGTTGAHVRTALAAAGTVGAGGTILAGIMNWLLANGPTLATEVVTMIQDFLPIIADFAAMAG